VIAAALFLIAAAVAPQDTGMLDVPVYRDEAFGVAIPRPFPDWVFSPGGTRGTSTVLFHPRDASLREQLWGALVLISFDRPVPLGEIADQRVRTTWQPALGRTFDVLTRDSITVAGLPAIHVVMGGAVNHLALDVEEYFIARGHDLVILQFRYPRGLPRDSIAAGYQRVFDGLEIRASSDGTRPHPVPVPAPPPPAEAARLAAAANRALAGSPWRPRAYEALVRFDPTVPRVEFAVRIEVVNDDVRPRDSLAMALGWPFDLDGVRTATGQPLATRSADAVTTVRLPQPVDPQGASAVTIAYHVAALEGVAGGIAVSGERVRGVANWFPRVAPWADSLDRPLDAPRPRYTLRFDLPEGFAAVAAGRLAADFASSGRRRVTWIGPGEPSPQPAFVVGRLRRVALRSGSLLTLRVWSATSDSALPPARAAAIADVVSDAWTFFSTSFGRLADEEADLVLADVRHPGAAGSFLFADPAAPDDSLRLAVARAWWGSAVRFAGPGADWLADALPAWSVVLLHAALDGDSTRQRLVREAETARLPLASVEAARRAVGDAAFRVALRGYFLEHRRVAGTLADLQSLLGPAATAALQPH